MSSHKTAETQERRSRGRPVSLEKRRAMQNAAIAEFRKQGYEGANMDAIAASAGVSKRTLYNHFPSKEALFRSLIDEMAGRIGLSSRIEYSADQPLRPQLLRYAHGAVKLLRDRETLALFRTILAEHVRRPDLVADAMARYWRDEYGFVEWVDAACRDGKLRARSPERASRLFTSLVKGVAVWPVVFRRSSLKPKEVDAALEEAVDVFLAYYEA